MTEPIVNEEPVIEAPEPEEVETESAPPGAKTDPELLLQSLQEEREKRRQEAERRKELERELEEAKRVQPADVFSDEGKLLKAEIDRLERKLGEKDQQDTLKQLESTYPALKDKYQEFEDYRTDPANAGMKLETAAKAFLVEKNLLETVQPRKGLERDTGGGRTPVKTGRTQEEIAELRVKNFRQYMKEVKAGTING